MPSPVSSRWHALATEAHAWLLHCADDSAPLPLAHLLPWLAPSEINHQAGLAREKPRAQYIAGRALCRAVLSKYSGVNPTEWKFRAGKSGKPAIIAPSQFSTLKFNLAHTQGLILCIVTRAGDVGIDAEETSRKVDILQVAKHFYSKQEQGTLANLTGDHRKQKFFDLWVLKEACLKARGHGLSADPARINIKIIRGKPSPIGNWQLTLKHLGKHHTAATAIRSKKPIPIKWFDAQQCFTPHP